MQHIFAHRIFASKLRIAGDKAQATREVGAGLDLQP
jgi:hypothetical protein